MSGILIFPDKEAAAGITDEPGRSVFFESSDKYNVNVKRDTHDPYCYWYGSADVEVKNKSTKALDDLWVVCE